jgi:hypothetical protein
VPETTSRLLAAAASLGLLMMLLAALAPDRDGVEPPERAGAAAYPVAPTPSLLPPPASSDAPPADEPGQQADPAPAQPSDLPTELPNGTREVFGRDDTLVAYYGTAGTGALGVLGEGTPERADRRLRAAARGFERPDRPVQRVYELIVTIADAGPGPDGDFNHDLSREQVQAWIDAARRDRALLVLDVQPGRSSFPAVAKRWEWALADPWVGLALDPEWRMGARGVPGQRIGSVDGREVDRTAAWLARLVRERGLPQKPLVVHQFRDSMLRRPGLVQQRPELALVQHVDGFGTRGQKLGTYAAVARPRQFSMGFKLFYDEDVRLMGPAAVLALRPRVRFVSYQ